MADDKKSFDDEKTVIEPRRPAKGAETPPPDDADRTVLVKRGASPPEAAPPPKAPPPPAGDADRTVVMQRRPAPPPADEGDRTVVHRAGAAGPAEGDRTVIRSSGATPAAGGGAFAVVCLSGPAKGQRFPLNDPDAMVGSGSGCQVRLPGTAAHHARIEQRGDAVEIQALGGPVTHRGRAVTRKQLKSGDLLKIGDVVVRFVRAGEVFSSSYTESDLGGGGPDLAALARDPKILGLVAIIVLGGGYWLLSSSEPEYAEQGQPAGPTLEEKRAAEIESLLASGEVMFNAGRLVAPPDQPDVDNAYRTFNRVVELDPGNERALEWLGKIDAELKRQASAREEAQTLRQQREREARERERRELQAKVDAILAEGDAFFERGHVAEPVGANALVKYREALEVDPESREAKERVRRAVYHYVARGDELREKDDLWRALENYRKASRAAGGSDSDIEARVRDTEARLRSGMGGSGTNLVMYKDDKGQLFVLDEMDKVPARYRDRAVEVKAAPPAEPGVGQ